MTFSLRNLLMIGLCLSLGACAFKKEDAEQKKTDQLVEDVTKKVNEQNGSNVDLKASNVSITFEPTEPGYYNLVITWPEAVGTMEIFINGSLQKSISGYNSFKQIVHNNDNLSISLRAYASASVGGRLLSTFEKDEQVPKDIIVRETINLQSDSLLNSNRFYFYSTGKIVTSGYSLKIRTKQLFVQTTSGQYGNPEDKANVITYRNSDSPTSDLNSNIEIVSDTAEGKLSVALIGLKGNDGQDAKTFAPSFPAIAQGGANGKNGETSYGKEICGADHEGCYSSGDFCATQPGNGENGKDGLNGTDGRDGSKGGSTGSLSIKIQNDSNFSVEVFQRPGIGGKGGAGIQGQKGGPAGAAGAPAPECNGAHPGQPGKDGRDGQPGKNGSCGEIGEVISNVKLTTVEKEVNSLCKNPQVSTTHLDKTLLPRFD